MDLTYASEYLLLTVLAVILVIGVALVLFARSYRELDLVLILGTVLCGIGLAVTVATMSVAEEQLDNERRAWIYETYGIQFSGSQYDELDFPTFEEPSADREVYGLTTGNRDNRLITVQLVWEDREFILVGIDGEQLEPLQELQ